MPVKTIPARDVSAPRSAPAGVPGEPKTALPAVVLTVRIVWRAGLEEIFTTRRREITAPVGAYLRELIEALGLPLRPALRVEPAHPGDLFPGAPLAVWLGALRLPPLLHGAPFLAPAPEGDGRGRGPTPAALAEWICRTLYHNRAELVTDEVAAAWLMAAGDGGDHLNLAQFTALLRRLAARGFSARRLTPALAGARAGKGGAPDPALYSNDLAVLYDQAVSGDAPALTLELARDLEAERAALEPELMQAADRFYATGVAHPRPKVKMARSLPPVHFRVRVNDLPLPVVAALPEGAVAVELAPQAAQSWGAPAVESYQPVTGGTLYQVDARFPIPIQGQAPPQYNRREHMLLHFIAALPGAAAGFLTRDLLEYYLTRLSETSPVLVEITNAIFKPSFIAEALRELLVEGISIYRLTALLEAMISFEGTQPRVEVERRLLPPPATRQLPFLAEDPAVRHGVAECAGLMRQAARRTLTNTLAPGGRLDACVLDPAANTWLAGLPPTPAAAERDRLILSVYRALDSNLAGASPAVLITHSSVRRRAAALLRPAMPNLTVLEPGELLPSLTITPRPVSLDPEVR